MAEETNSFARKIKKYVNRFSSFQKIFLGAVFILIIVGIILIINLVSPMDYEVLYTNLSIKDSGLIIEKLKEHSVSFRLTDGGSTIKVPENQVAELRIRLAAAGLPEGREKEFEIFAKPSLSSSDFTQNIRYIQAVEDELARTLSQLREVISAKVHITLPKRSEQEEVKASIVLNLRPEARVSGTIVPAVLHLAAQAVEGLKPGNIAIVDVNGNLLSRPGSDQEEVFDELTTTQMAYQRKMEKNLAGKIIALLEPYVGPGKVRAEVKLILNFDKVETTEETVDPESLAKISEKSETTSSADSKQAGGIPGTGSRIGTPGAGTKVTTSAAPLKLKSEKSAVNYEVSRKTTRLTKPVGEIKRISAAVVVDDAIDVRLQDGELIKQPRKRTPDELEAIKKIAQAAVGFNIQRGDVIEVANLPFDTSAETVSEYYLKKQKSEDLINSFIKYTAYALGFLLVFLLILKPLGRKFSFIIREGRLPGGKQVEAPRLDREKLAALLEAKDEADIEQELLEKYRIPKSARKKSILRGKVKKFVSENTDEAASLVKSILIED